jgi:hypothetical protein
VSDGYLRIIPDDPCFVPSAGCQRGTADLLQALVPESAVVAKQSENVKFFDAGENFERVLCPNCRAELTDVWPSAMDHAWSTRFSDLTFMTPCCGRECDLNRLVYEWPAGFARFVLEVSGSDVARFLPERQIESVAQLLGCQVRQILSRY